jgi:hypothetical protein
MNLRYRMPTVFGPSVGPRSGPGGETYDYGAAERISATVSFLTDAAPLSRLLPPGFTLDGPPVVTVEWTALLNLQWLAGRSYNTLGVRYNARFQGATDTARGPFLAVLWENRPEPILSGREELGFAKLYCDLPEPRIIQGHHHLTAAWDHHTFMQMELHDLADAATPAASASPVDGTLHYRYFPKVSAPGEADVHEVVLTPAGGFASEVLSRQHGQGRVSFVPSTWEQLPTMYQVSQALAALPQLEMRGATRVHSRGAKDLSDQRVLR